LENIYILKNKNMLQHEKVEIEEKNKQKPLFTKVRIFFVVVVIIIYSLPLIMRYMSKYYI